ncbi:hypothetical protein TNCV_780401 [Trichonephila clavipes]|nr:hypothetical protein TNCV_780401 [Trichonephila clavipes]
MGYFTCGQLTLLVVLLPQALENPISFPLVDSTKSTWWKLRSSHVATRVLKMEQAFYSVFIVPKNEVFPFQATLFPHEKEILSHIHTKGVVTGNELIGTKSLQVKQSLGRAIACQ